MSAFWSYIASFLGRAWFVFKMSQVFMFVGKELTILAVHVLLLKRAILLASTGIEDQLVTSRVIAVGRNEGPS